MHFIVMIRYAFFVIAILSLTGLFVMSLAGIHNSVILSPGLLFLSLLMSIYLTALLTFDFIRTKNGFGYRCFVFKIWWELTSLTIFTIVVIILTVVGITKPQGAACFHSQAASAQLSPHICSISNGIWTFEIALAAVSFCYILFLGTVTVEYYQRTPAVLKAGVRDFDWKGITTPRPYHIDYDPYTGSAYTINSQDYALKKFKTRLSNARATQPMTYRSPQYVGSNASRSTFATSASSVTLTAPSNSTVTFANLRKMEEAHVRPTLAGTRFIEQLDD